jgi:hypothetical protein
MSYPLDLDEIGEERIKLELSQREQNRAAGLCDYCNRPPSSPVCKFPRRHKDQRIRTPEQLRLEVAGAVAKKLEETDGGEHARFEKYLAMQGFLHLLTRVGAGQLVLDAEQYQRRAADILAGRL